MTHAAIAHAALERTPAFDATLLLRPDLTQLGLMLAVAGSIANAIAASQPCQFNQYELQALQPDPEPVRSKITALVPLMDHQIAVALQRLVTLVGLARNLTNGFTAIEPRSPRIFEVVADAWRRAASICIVVELMVDGHGDARQLLDASQFRTNTTEMLRDVCRGKSPCLTTSGELRIPGWAERRSDARIAIGALVEIEYKGERLIGHTENASASGLNIRTSKPLLVGAHLRMVLDGARALTGRVIWNTGEYSGIALDQRIDPVALVRM